jgi:hypothetical protein
MDAANHHPLVEPWTIWSRLPSNTVWTGTVSDYIQIATVDTVEDVVGVLAAIPNDVLENTLWYTMRSHIMPLYEDPQNTNGGFFSYKVNCKDVRNVWNYLNYCLVCGQLMKDPAIMRTVTGLSISSKKKFCIVKIWMSTTLYQDPKSVMNHHIPGLNVDTGMFGLHPKA